MPCGCAAVDRAKAVAQGVRSPTTHGHERRGGAGGTRQARANEPKGLSQDFRRDFRRDFSEKSLRLGHVTLPRVAAAAAASASATAPAPTRGRGAAAGGRKRAGRGDDSGDNGGDDGEERGDNAAMAGGGDAGDDGGNGVATAGVSLTSRAQGAR